MLTLKLKMESLPQTNSTPYLSLKLPNFSTVCKPYLIFAYPSSSLSFSSFSSSSSSRPCSSHNSFGRRLVNSMSVIVKAKGKDNKEDSHSSASNPDESTWFFPEAVLLKEKKVQEDGKVLPEFADAEEQQLYEALRLEMESGLDVEEMRHYEVVYLIHEKYEEEVGSVNEKVQEFMREKKGIVWRFNDWGTRRLAYKIKKAKHAHYILMNFELDAKWINDFKSLLDKDERVIRHLVVKMDEAVTKDCPPPPDFFTMRGYIDDDDDEEEEYYYIEYDEEEEEEEEEEGEGGEVGEEEENNDDEVYEDEDDGEGEGETDDKEGCDDDAKEEIVVNDEKDSKYRKNKSKSVRQPLRKLKTEKIGR